MPKPAERAYSRYASDAVTLLGQMIRIRRIEAKTTTTELAERAGVSRTLLHRIERGDPACSVGAMFECAAIVGVDLFAADANALSEQVDEKASRLALLPRSIRKPASVVKDDF